MKKHKYSHIFPANSIGISLRTGLLLVAGGTPFRVVEIHNGDVVLQHLQTQEMKLVREQKLLAEMQSGTVTQITSPATSTPIDAVLDAQQTAQIRARNVSDAAVQVMVNKVQWIRALRQAGVKKIRNTPWIRIKIDQLASTILLGNAKLGASTLESAEQVLDENDGDPLALLPEFSLRGGVGKSRLHPLTEQVIQEVLDQVLQKNDRVVKKHITQTIQVRLEERQQSEKDKHIEIPGASTIARRIDERISKFELCLRNEGRSRALRLYRENGARISAERPLELTEIDDIDSGVFLIDAKTSLPVGRCYLTNGVDQFTAVPMGLSLSHQHRSVESAVECILDALLPKNESLPEYAGLHEPWEGYGTAGINLMDNAMYNHASEVERVQFNLKQIVAWSKPKQPTEKSGIEHFNHLVKNSFCVRLPGWRGVRSNPDGSKEGAASAVMSESEFRRIYVEWVTSEYLNTPGIDGLTPRQRWRRYFQHHRPIVKWTRDQIALFRMRSTELRFRDSGGLLRLGLRYQSDALAELRKFMGKNAKVQAFFDPKDVSFMLVKHPITGMFLKAECIENDRYVVGMTERLQQLVLKQARELGYKNPSLAQCVQARQTLAERTEQMRLSTKLRTRQRGLLDTLPDFPKGDEAPTKKVKQASSQTMLSDLEWSINQLDLIQLNEGDIWMQKEPS